MRVDTVEDDPTDADTAGVQYYLADQIARNFTITPDVVYQGETDKTFRVTYTANGPMYSITARAASDGDVGLVEAQQASIEITIPPGDPRPIEDGRR